MLKTLQSMHHQLGRAIILGCLCTGYIAGFPSCSRTGDEARESSDHSPATGTLNLLALADLLQVGMSRRDVIRQLGTAYERQKLDGDRERYTYYIRWGAIRPIVSEANVQVIGIDIVFVGDRLVEWRPISGSREGKGGNLASSPVGLRTFRLFLVDEGNDTESDRIHFGPNKVLADLELESVIFQRFRDVDGKDKIAVELRETQAVQLGAFTGAHLGRMVIVAFDDYALSRFRLDEAIQGRTFSVPENISL